MDLEAMKDKGRKALKQTAGSDRVDSSSNRPMQSNLQKAKEVLQGKATEKMGYKEGFD